MSESRYRQAGVDLEAAARFVDRIRPLAAQTRRPGVLADIGGFGGLFHLDPHRWRDPVLVSGTDGVGTKLLVARMADRHDTVGVDLVAMCVNDVLVMGAEPLFFLDYLATGRLRPEQLEAVVRGIAEGCQEAGCALIGGETAELPGMYGEGEYDLAGFAVGVVEREQILDGRGIRPGDAILGLASSGLHANGFSLVRRVFFEEQGWDLGTRPPGWSRTLVEELLVPTRIYVHPFLALLREGFPVRAAAHITGGGIFENLPRVLPEGVRAHIHLGRWPIPAVFETLQEVGRISREEMFRTFNMGIGFVVVTAQEAAEAARTFLEARGYATWVIGEIREGPRGVVLEGRD